MNEGPSIEHSLMVVSTAPDRIWLDLGFDPSDEDEVSFHELIDVTWSHDNASGYGVEYVRVDTTPPQREWVNLTDDEIKEIIGSWGDTPVKGYTRKLMDQIQDKLKEKNHG